MIKKIIKIVPEVIISIGGVIIMFGVYLILISVKLFIPPKIIFDVLMYIFINEGIMFILGLCATGLGFKVIQREIGRASCRERV